MRIALIRPGLGLKGSRKYTSLACLEPLSLAILAALTPQDIEVVAFDDRIEDIDYSDSFSLVALSVGTFQARRAYEISEEFRALGVKVIIGGFHAAFCSDEVLEHADSVAKGEAESLWPLIIDDLRKGTLKKVYEASDRPSLSGILPDRSVFMGKRYMPMSVIQFGRGCHHNCDFCCIKAYYGKQCRHRPIEDVIAEIMSTGRKWIFFTDDNLISHKKRAKDFLRAIIPLKLKWTSQVSIDCVDDDELLQLMKESGCQCVVIGLESLDSENMTQMGKGWSDVSKYSEKLEKIRSLGIMIYGTFVFGYDSDTPRVFEKTLKFTMDEKMFVVNFNHLQPYPGTPLYERLKAEGKLIYDSWWLEEDYRFGDACFEPENMTALTLTDKSHEMRVRFYSWTSILKRLWEFKANCGSLSNFFVFLIINFISRQDIRVKHKLGLGLKRSKVADKPGTENRK
jgi:radical SAM superfamily enzyme YgiQ (UPF0313 family)